ncbi:MAG: hypothetical protein C0506_10125 [Anaerolinea sp.]|nr:hypothetical protein [Anaerolinea sp.]
MVGRPASAAEQRGYTGSTSTREAFPMLFNVATLLREPAGSGRDYVLQPDPPVHRGTVQLIRTPGGVLVLCEADVLLEATCSRCLAPFAYPAHIMFEEVFAQQVEVATGSHLPPPEDPEAFLIALNHTIDITEAVRQYSEMAAVMQPLCRPDCPGICPECGQDLSIAACRCERRPIDSRWAALAALKRTSNG